MKSKYKVETPDGCTVKSGLTLDEAYAQLKACFDKGQKAYMTKDAAPQKLNPYPAFYAQVDTTVIRDAVQYTGARSSDAEDFALVHTCDDSAARWVSETLGIPLADVPRDAYIVLWEL